MNDHDLDALISAHGDSYNSPPAEPPLGAIRNKVHEARRRRSTQRWVTAALAAAAAVVIAVGLATRSGEDAGSVARSTSQAPRAVASEPASDVANRALAAALRSAQSAAANNPEDPYYAEHYRVMQRNAAYFHGLQQRQAGGTT